MICLFDGGEPWIESDPSSWSICNVSVIVNGIGIGNTIFGLCIDPTPELTFNLSIGNFITLITYDSIDIDVIKCDPTNSLFNLTNGIILIIVSITTSYGPTYTISNLVGIIIIALTIPTVIGDASTTMAPTTKSVRPTNSMDIIIVMLSILSNRIDVPVNPAIILVSGIILATAATKPITVPDNTIACPICSAPVPPPANYNNGMRPLPSPNHINNTRINNGGDGYVIMDMDHLVYPRHKHTIVATTIAIIIERSVALVHMTHEVERILNLDTSAVICNNHNHKVK